jgi:hypothetical protein
MSAKSKYNTLWGEGSMPKYLDWVNVFKEKGTSVKKVGDEYYLYRSTSRRVTGEEIPSAGGGVYRGNNEGGSGSDKNKENIGSSLN